MVLQTYAEVRFLKAEMAFRGWSVPGDAKTHYEAGVKAAMQMLSGIYPMLLLYQTRKLLLI